MPTRYSQEQRDEVARLRADGWGWRRISRRLGIPHTTLRRWANPDYADRMRRMSREAKRRRTGICESCGAETHYGGGKAKHGRAVGRFCGRCGPSAGGAMTERIWTRDAMIKAARRWAREHGRPPTHADFRGQNGYPWYTVVYRTWHRWHLFLRDAGWPATPPSPNSPFRKQDVA